MISSVFPDLRNLLGIAGTYWMCAGFSFLYILVTLFLLPETKAKSLEDIQHYFQQRRESPLQIPEEV